MRDAFGGAFMIKIFLVFIFIYICFTALALNYAKAFKVKNKIINYLEDNEIVDVTTGMTATAQGELEKFFEQEILGNMNYYEEIDCDIASDETNEGNVYCYEGGVKIEQAGISENPKAKEIYYTVTTYVGWDLGFLNKLLQVSGKKGPDNVPGKWEISGETRLIVNE